MKKILFIFGGKSPEHYVSISSCKSIYENIRKEKYEIGFLYIDFLGVFYEVNSPNDLEDKKDFDLQKFRDYDVIFPIIHGLNGEDGTVQGFLSTIGIPYVGSNTWVSSTCMDKFITKLIMNYHHIQTPSFVCLLSSDYSKNKKNSYKLIIEKIGLPCYVKPARNGSSIGISHVKNINELGKAIQLGFHHDEKIIIEEEILGKEIECAVIGNKKIIVSKVGEVITKSAFYDYKSKYESEESFTEIPAKINKELTKKIQLLSNKIYNLLECKGLARIDFFIEKNTDNIYFNEINTIPGFTKTSMFPKLFENSKVKYSDLLDYLINLAMEGQ